MTGVYIPNINIPETCSDCFAREIAGAGAGVSYCRITGASFLEDRRLRFCPLVPVPDHKRCVDVDAFWVEINKICDRRDAGIISDFTCLNQILSAIRHAPTILSKDND